MGAQVSKALLWMPYIPFDDEDVVEGNRKIERPRLRWKELVNDSIQKLVITTIWTENAKVRIDWRDMFSSFCKVPSAGYIS